MADFENGVQFKDNVLNAYRSYSYHLTLTMINPLNIDMYMDDAGAIKAEDQVTIAQTGTTTLLNIDGLDLQVTMSFGSGARDGLGARGQFIISEPVTFNFYKFLHLSAQNLGVKVLTQAQYVLTVRFQSDAAETQYDKNQTVYSWPIKITSIDSSYGSSGEGSQHICNFIEVGFADLQNSLQLHKGITIDDCKTFGEAIKALEKKLYEQEFDDIQSASPSRGVTDVYKIAINYPALADSKWIQEKYQKLDRGPHAGAKVFLEPKFTFKAGISVSNVIKTLWQATKINEKIVNDISAQKAGEKKAAKRAERRGEKKQAKRSYRLTYYTLNTNIKSTMFDDSRNDYALFWDIKLDPYTVMDHRNDTRKEKEADSIKNIEEKNKTGHLNKFYRYQFTGLNTDVLNLDLKFNTLYYIASPPYDGLLATSGGTSQTAQTLSPEKKSKAGVGTDGAIKVIVRNPPGSKANLGMGSLQANKETFQVLTVEPTARQYRAPKEDLPQKFAESFTTKNVLSDALTRNTGTFLTSRGQDEDNQTSMTQKSNYQLMNLENVVDLVNIEMEIRGDPYWFGRPRKISNAKVKAFENTYPDYFKGAAYFLLDTRFGEEYSEDGLIHTDQLDIFAGLYQVVTVTSQMQGGIFKQYLKSIRHMSAPNSVISKLLLAADAPEKEPEQQEANAPEPGGGPG